MTEELNEELKNELLELVSRKIEDVTEEYFNILREKDFKADNVVKECTFNFETNVNVDGNTIQHFNNIISAIDKQNEIDKMKWYPKQENRSDCYVIQTHGCVINTVATVESVEFGTVFKTEKRAEHASKKYRKFHLLYKLAEELNDTVRGHPFECWCIQYMGDSKKMIPVRFTEACNGLLPMIQFKNKDLALQAIKIIENGGLE